MEFIKTEKNLKQKVIDSESKEERKKRNK